MFSSEKKEQAYKPDRYGYVPVKVPEFVADENPPQVKIHETTGLKDLQDVLEEAAENDRIWCGKVKFVFWALLGLILIGGVIALSVLMVVVQENKSPTGTVPQPLGVTGTTSGSGSSSSTSSSSTSSSSSSSNNANTPPSPPPPPPSDENGQLKIMSNPPFTPPAGYTALWWDEFDGTSLNTNFWNFDTGYGAQYGLWEWGNQEQEYYTTNPANVNVSNGYLYITALQEDTVLPDGFTFHYTSGRINSKGKVAFFGGMNTSDGRQWNNIRIESSLKAPQATTGLWAAYWMLPIDLRYGVWASSGEIDIYEMKNDFTHNNMAFHYGGPYPKYNQRYNLYKPPPDGGSYSTQFVTATLDWAPTEMSISINGQQLISMKSRSVDPHGWWSQAQAFGAPPNSPFDIPFYFVINLSVGGKYPGNATSASIFPNTFTIDYIRVYGKQ